MMLGMDYPHHEGTFIGAGSRDYMRATLGAAEVPEGDARIMLGGSAIQVFGMNADRLNSIADSIGSEPADILTAPTQELFPRGDVHRPSRVA